MVLVCVGLLSSNQGNLGKWEYLGKVATLQHYKAAALPAACSSSSRILKTGMPLHCSIPSMQLVNAVFRILTSWVERLTVKDAFPSLDL